MNLRLQRGHSKTVLKTFDSNQNKSDGQAKPNIRSNVIPKTQIRPSSNLNLDVLKKSQRRKKNNE